MILALTIAILIGGAVYLAFLLGGGSVALSLFLIALVSAIAYIVTSMIVTPVRRAAAAAERRADGRLALSYAPERVPAEQIVDALRAGGVPMADLSTEQPDLQDVFLSLTGGR